MVSKYSSNSFDIRSAAKFVTAVGLIILSVGILFAGNVVYRNHIARECRTYSHDEFYGPKRTMSPAEQAAWDRAWGRDSETPQERHARLNLENAVKEVEKQGVKVCAPKIKLKSTLPFSIGGPITFVGLTLLAGTKKSKVDPDISDDGLM